MALKLEISKAILLPVILSGIFHRGFPYPLIGKFPMHHRHRRVYTVIIRLTGEIPGYKLREPMALIQRLNLESLCF
jgi:hypothetical protein